jgi:erythronate-4-phosphate dehydrogenase
LSKTQFVKIVADDKIPFLRGALEPWAQVCYLPGKEISHDIVRDADALIIRTRTKCNELLLKNTSVRFIGTATIGFDHIDTAFCENNNIRWTNAPGCNSSSVRQYIASVLMNIGKVKDFSLSDKTIGIIGVGNVGSKVEQFARATGMNVLLNDPPRARMEGSSGFVPLSAILEQSDIISVHVPLTRDGVDSTFRLFNDNLFSRIKPGTFFINSSRGEVVHTGALASALGTGRLSGAAIDVWENEPDIDMELLSKVLIGTPHIAGYSTDGKANGTSMVINELSRFFGLPLQGWYPADVPEPEQPVIIIDGRGKSDQQIISEAIEHTYDVLSDDKKLRDNPSGFERQRGEYPVRREFTSYSVRLENVKSPVAEKLAAIGFKL